MAATYYGSGDIKLVRQRLFIPSNDGVPRSDMTFGRIKFTYVYQKYTPEQILLSTKGKDENGLNNEFHFFDNVLGMQINSGESSFVPKQFTHIESDRDIGLYRIKQGDDSSANIRMARKGTVKARLHLDGMRMK